MKIITINLPNKYLSALHTLTSLGIYPNRSEAVRIALRDFLVEELQHDKDLDPETFKELLEGN